MKIIKRNINYFNQGTITPGIYTGPNSPFVFTILPNNENINNDSFDVKNLSYENYESILNFFIELFNIFSLEYKLSKSLIFIYFCVSLIAFL